MHLRCVFHDNQVRALHTGEVVVPRNGACICQQPLPIIGIGPASCHNPGPDMWPDLVLVEIDNGIHCRRIDKIFPGENRDKCFRAHSVIGLHVLLRFLCARGTRRSAGNYGRCRH